MKPVTRISTTPAPASTRRRRFGGTPSCSRQVCWGIRTLPAPLPPMRRDLSSDRGARCSTGSTPGDDYIAIFTLNATGALKHVGESYPFSAGDRLLLTVDNHNSVNGIREFAVARGARCRTRLSRRRSCASIDPRSTLAEDGEARWEQSVRLSRAVQLHGREASAGARRRSPREWMGRAARCSSIRSDQSTRPAASQSRVRACLSTRCSGIRLAWAACWFASARSRSSGVRGSQAAP